MKKLILLEFVFLLLATTFQTDNPPGWFQQQLPVNDFVNDIYFLDSLNGWVATNGSLPNDTAYLIRTTNGGKHWEIINISFKYYTKLQFLNNDTGYAAGAPGALWKTIDGGFNWNSCNSGLPFGIDDMQFINYDTGWVSAFDFEFGGIWKTTDGANNWTKQLSPPATPILAIKAIYILNKDTGWAINNSGSVKELYRTTNGGTNWNVQYTFSSGLGDVHFFNSSKGIISSGRFYYTTDGGFTWTPSQSQETGGKLSFANDSIGWAGYNLNVISKTTTGGITWFYQTTNANNPTPFALSPLNVWAGGNKLIHTTDGGGLSSVSENNLLVTSFILNQNYPNPFNPVTIISYRLKLKSFVTLEVFDMEGREINTLVSQSQNTGNYDIEFNGSTLSSGIYFYRIEISTEKEKRVQSDTKKMILIK